MKAAVLRKRKHILHAVIVFALVTVPLLSCRQPEVARGRIAPDFVLSDLEGGRFYLNAQKGKVILLNFWSIHCVPCLQEMPLLQKLQEDYANKDAAIIGICTDPGEAGYIDSFLKGLGVTYPVLMDTEYKVASLYNIHALPATYIIDQQGMIQYNTTGYAEGYVEMYISKLDELLRRK
jgi:peroxiredoxin